MSIAADIRLQTFRNILSMLRGTKGHPRLLDLACGHGAFSLEARALGWRVTAVDVRTKRMPMTRGIDWIQSDVRDYRFTARDFDAIACLGLLYHLELPDQIQLLRRCSDTTTIVDTHVSLTPARTESGYEGHDFDELAGRTPEQHEWSGTASWKNHTSFWPTEPALIRMLQDCGFGSVFKLVPDYRPDRTFWICSPNR